MKNIFRFKLTLALIILSSMNVLNSPGSLIPTLIPLGNQPNGLATSGNNLYVTTDVSSDDFFSVFESDGEGILILSGPENTSTGSGEYNPLGAMVASGSALYGTGSQGNSDPDGCVFAVNTNGSDFVVLHTFGGADGSDPQGGLILSGNTLYGTTSTGGSNNVGTVFAIGTGGDFTNLYSFTGGGGANPQGGLILSGNTLYGTTSTGGSNNVGTVFAIGTGGDFTNLYSFTGGGGANPRGGLILSGNTLYGTTSAGGGNNDGTVFAINTNGTGYKVLHMFTGIDGYNPQCAPVLVGDNLYGVTSNSISDGCIFFAVNTNGLGFTNLDSGFVTDLTGGLVALPAAANTTLFGMGTADGSLPVIFAFTLDAVTAEPLVVTTTSLPNATNGLAYNQTLAATGGQHPYHWTNSLGTIPRGLTLATNGVISGTPTTHGAFNFTVTVTDSLSAMATQALALTISLPPLILSTPQITVGGTNFTFLLSGPAGSNFVLQVSTNLLNWNPVSTSTIPISGSLFLSNAISGYNRRFYQVHWQ